MIALYMNSRYLLMGSSLFHRLMFLTRLGSVAWMVLPGRMYCVTLPQRSFLRHCSVPWTLPSPIRVIVSSSVLLGCGVMSIILCRTYFPGAISANTASYSDAPTGVSSSTLSRWCSRNGRMLHPLTTMVAVCPSFMAFLTAPSSMWLGSSMRGALVSCPFRFT